MDNLDELLLRQVVGDAPHGLGDVALVRLDVHLRVFGRLVRRRDPSEVCPRASA